MIKVTLNQFVEVTTVEISKNEKSESFEGNKQVTKRSERAVGNVRKEIAAPTGRQVITSKKAVDFSRLIMDVAERGKDYV